MPPVARSAAVRVKPVTMAVMARAQQARIAVKVVDGLVHDNDAPQSHRFDLLIRELLANEAHDLDVGGGEFTLTGIDEDLPRDQIIVLKEYALENSDLGGYAVGWREVRRTEHLLGVATHPRALALESDDPFSASCSVGSD